MKEQLINTAKVILLLILIPILLSGCNLEVVTPFPPSCDAIEDYNYFHLLIEDVEIGNYYKTSYGANSMNEGNEVVDFDLFFMDLHFTRGRYAYTEPNQTGNLVKIDNRLESCISNSVGYVQQIEDIIFTTNLDYNDNFKAGDNINDLIILNTDWEDPIPSLEDFLARDDKPVNHLNSYHLTERPTLTNNISISVEVRLTHGGMFEATALPITFE